MDQPVAQDEEARLRRDESLADFAVRAVRASPEERLAMRVDSRIRAQDVLDAVAQAEEARRAREAMLVLAASRGAFVAARDAGVHLGDAARSFGYRARTPEGDAFETAFEWAREQVRLGG